MAVRKKIAVLVGQADEFYQRRFIDGFLKEVFKADFDVCIFSMFLKYQDTEARECGDSRIYALVNYELFDAVVVLADTLQTPGLAKKIEDKLKESYKKPVLYVDLPNDYYPTILTDSYTPVKRLIQHLIEIHGYKDIAYLTGKKWHPHSKARLKAYKDAMAEAGLTVRNDRVFYGDFWYTSGKSCAEQLLKNRDNMPEAVACANDCMAIGLCEELVNNGINIPEDIAIIGFDTGEEGQRSPQPLTSAYIPADSTGARAGRSIISLINGGKVDESPDEAEMFIGYSCGCHNESCTHTDLRRESWTTELSGEGYFSLHNHFLEDLMAQTDISAFWDTVYLHVHELGDYESFYLCLPKSWSSPDFSDDDTVGLFEYPDRMMMTIASYEGGSGQDKAGISELFATGSLLPDIHEERNEPRAYIFTSLYYEKRNYGYAVINYGESTRSFDGTYRLWMQTLSCGLESMRRASILEALMSGGNAAAINKKFPGGISGKFSAPVELSKEDEETLEFVSKILDENLFTYHFQPIVSAVDGSIYAFEALMRADVEKKISPLDIIKYADMLKRLPDVEKATFINVLTKITDEQQAFGERHVFINSIPGTKLSDEDNEKIEALLSSKSKQAVVELTEQAELDDNELDNMKKRYERLGIGTAVDDYGTGYSNVANLLRYMPNYVKVDRSLLSGIQDSQPKQHFVREIVSFAHDNDIKVLAEGVETTDELRTVIYLGCDLIQGYYTARPSAEIIAGIDPKIVDEICRYQKEKTEGTYRRSYKTGRGGRISTGSLVREGYQVITTTGEAVTYRDYVIAGIPGQRTELTLEILEGYEGQITLENVNFYNTKHRPCIDIAPGAKVSLVLVGENKLEGGGIRVPEGATLTLYGDGDLNIRVSEKKYAGIGCTDGKTGKLEFYQDGSVIIDSGGTSGVCIGGTEGSDIIIHKGRYVTRQNSTEGVAIGCMDGDCRLNISDCELDLTFSGGSAAGIGSLNGKAEIVMEKNYFHCYATSEEYCALGSCKGPFAKVILDHLGIEMDVRTALATGTGALYGESDLYFDNIGYRYSGIGAKNYALGGIDGIGTATVIESSATLRIRNDNDHVTMMKFENMHARDCRVECTINGVQKTWNGSTEN